MKTTLRKISVSVTLLLSLTAAVLTGCSDVAEPENKQPVLVMASASDISRTGATVSVDIKNPGGSCIDFVRFRYGEDTSMDQVSQKFESPVDRVVVKLSGLKPGHEYFICAEGGTEYSVFRSETMTFRTDPNATPVVGDISVLSKGPVGIIVAFEIPDDGGIPLTAAGCKVVDTAAGDTTRLNSEDLSLRELTFHISGLDREKDYSLIPYAANAEGETSGKEFKFRTDNAVSLTVAGTLKGIFGDFTESLDTLRITGEMNGDDFAYLRKMLKAPVRQNETELRGKVENVDLSDVRIVDGGGTYDGNRFTNNDKVSKGMFADCAALVTIRLPMTATMVETDAFRDCPVMESLEISVGITSVSPSSGCISLKKIDVAGGNSLFKSVEGVLFDYAVTGIVWFPLGKDGDYALPSTVKAIGENAFKGAGITSITLPETIETIGRSAFADSMLRTVTVPESVTSIPYALFQNCMQLEEVRFGGKTNFIGDYAFYGTENLRHLYLPSSPPVASGNAFPGSDSGLMENCTLHVPAGKTAVYRNHRTWGEFKNIVEF